jgi:hypothetical protein
MTPPRPSPKREPAAKIKEPTKATVTSIHSERLGEFEGEEVVQIGCGGIDNISGAFTAHLRVRPHTDMKGDTILVVARLDCNGVNFVTAKTMEDKSERRQHYRATEVFVAPESLWRDLHQSANEAHDAISNAALREKGQARLGEPIDQPERPS